MTVKENVALAPYTTFRIGGPARFFAEAHSLDEVREAIDFARTRDLPLFILGGGSNILVADQGFAGLVLAVRIAGIAAQDDGGMISVTAGAGVKWDDVSQWAAERGLCGLECLSGIPGTVGGAVVANVGAYGSQCSDTFQAADVIDRAGGAEVRTLRKEECDFAYHDSIFAKDPGRFLILNATFLLQPGGKPKLAYRDSRFDMRTLAAESGDATPASARELVLRVREEKGVLEGSFRCAGSVFHMPFVTHEAYEKVLRTAEALDAAKEERLRPWAWPQKDGSYKLAPGFLLEFTEFQKGYVRGPVGISPKHTLSIINIGDARASHVAALARDMQDAVEKIFSIRLEREVEYIGAVE